MWLFEFGQFELSPEKQYSHCAHKQNKQQHGVVEVTGDHVESLVGGSSDKEVIHTKAKDK